MRVADAVGSRLGLAWFSTAEWAQASREVIRLRRDLRALRKEREAQLAIDEAVNEARERVRRRRPAVEPTQPFAIAEEPPPSTDDSTTRTAPTVRR